MLRTMYLTTARSSKSSCSDNWRKANKRIIIQQIRKSLRGKKTINLIYINLFRFHGKLIDSHSFKDVGFASKFEKSIKSTEIPRKHVSWPIICQRIHNDNESKLLIKGVSSGFSLNFVWYHIASSYPIDWISKKILHLNEITSFKHKTASGIPTIISKSINSFIIDTGLRFDGLFYLLQYLHEFLIRILIRLNAHWFGTIDERQIRREINSMKNLVEMCYINQPQHVSSAKRRQVIFFLYDADKIPYKSSKFKCHAENFSNDWLWHNFVLPHSVIKHCLSQRKLNTQILYAVTLTNESISSDKNRLDFCQYIWLL